MNRDETVYLLREITEDYGAEIKPSTIDAWCRHLQDYDVATVKTAYKRFFDSDTKGKMPTISQICSVLKGVSSPKSVVYFDRPPLHWNKFGELEDDEGRTYADPSWTDEDYQRQRGIYRARQKVNENTARQVQMSIEELVKTTAAKLGG